MLGMPGLLQVLLKALCNVIFDAKYRQQIPSMPTLKTFADALASRPLQSNVTHLLQALNLLFQHAPGSSWAEGLHDSGLFVYLIQTIKEEKISTVHILEYIHLLSRIVIVDPHSFINLMAATASKSNQAEALLWADILEHWLTKVLLLFYTCSTSNDD